MYEINLIRERVVPKNLMLKRAIIAGSTIGAMVLAAIVLAFLGMRLSPEIQQHKIMKDQALATKLSLEEQVRKVEEIVAQKNAAKDVKRKLEEYWNAPMQAGAIYELCEILANSAWVASKGIKPPEGYSDQSVAVRRVTFEATSRTEYRTRFVLLVEKYDNHNQVVEFVKSLLGDPMKPDAPPTALRTRGAFSLPKFVTDGNMNTLKGSAPDANVQPQDTQGQETFVIFELQPANLSFYANYKE